MTRSALLVCFCADPGAASFRLDFVVLQLDPQTVCDTVHKCKVGDDRTEVVNRPIVQARLPQRLNILGRDLTGGACQFDGVIQYSPVNGVQLDLAVVLNDRFHEFLNLRLCKTRTQQLATETSAMMDASVMALVQRRDDSCHQFALPP